ncbi:MAG: glutathione S-transferase family protein [Myxococcota bacterium]
MRLLVEGNWVDRWYNTKESDGHFKRSAAAFRNWITADGGPGPSGDGGFEAASGRYHLYVSYACPWAHRTLIFRKLMGLEEHIGVSVVHSFMGEHGWTFADGPKVVPDPVMNADFLHQLYTRAKADYSGRVTVPVLWDRERNTVVSNESSEIIRMFNGAFRGVAKPLEDVDFYPEALRSSIDTINAHVYSAVNNGVYKSGFATTQHAYDQSVGELFECLDELEARLGEHRYLVGSTLTEADWRLFTTLVRFDAVYHGHFKCNRRALREYANLWAYTRELYQWPGVAETVHFDHIVEHYHRSHESINPHRIVPIGPKLDFNAPHGRGRSFS